ncbi:Isoprenylcysteine carboxyl methyltransferase family-domain-containing protein [Obelidium mucronatum]|nr:Isoprenylcysteine carboxyl methyltransferase family-domain-containing protein [Obelidium mucronatum]
MANRVSLAPPPRANPKDASAQPPPPPPLTPRRLLGRLADTPHSHARVAVVALGLGAALGGGVAWAALAQTDRPLGLYAAFLALFHFMEYLTTAMHRHDVGINSFVLNHSRQYHFALVFGLVEYFVESYFWPQYKLLDKWTILGCFLVLFFQSLRSFAMMNAGANFTHLISFRKEDDHVLVKDGIYKYLRHPSYTAFFYWAPLLQLCILKNPIAFGGYICALYYFFSTRIEIEEDVLIRFFGKEYLEYRKQTWVLIPGIQ